MTWPDVAHVTVPGSGTASGPPDVVAVTLTVTGRGDDPADALRACGRTQSTALVALAEAGATDVRSTSITVHDEWDHEHHRPGRPQAQSELSAMLPDVAAAGDALVRVLQAAPEARLQALTPQHQDQSQLLRQARAAAFADARDRAAQHAALAGSAVGPLLRMVEADRSPAGFRAESLSVGNPSSGFDVAAGPTSVSVTVEATWALLATTD